jgi:amidohydrolase
MAAADRFQITVRGRQTHGARPWDGVDLGGRRIIKKLGLQTVASRQVDVTLAPSIVSIGRISGGIRNNVIPDAVELEGTIRSFDPAMRTAIHQRMERTARGIAESAGATVDWELELGNPPVVNDPALLDRMLPTLNRAATVRDINPQTVAEDFSEYAIRAPSLFMFLGNGPPGVDPATLPTNHSPFFDMHEPNLEVGVRVFSNLVVDYLRGR